MSEFSKERPPLFSDDDDDAGNGNSSRIHQASLREMLGPGSRSSDAGNS